MKVCVVGGGPAGSAAAAEASDCGAEVTLFERHEVAPPPSDDWPDFIRSPGTPSPRASVPRGVEATFGVSVLAVRAGCRVYTAAGTRPFDSVVLASGSSALVRPFPGVTKRGVFVLATFEDCLRLARERSSLERPVVLGRGLRALRVADALLEGGRTVCVAGPDDRPDPRLDPSTSLVLRKAAEARGASFFSGQSVKAVGTESVEAVVLDGEVHACDALVVVPSLIPSLPAGDLRRGPCGGALVGASMESSIRDCYAAGGCAELAGVSAASATRTLSLHYSCATSSRVAGANAAGRFLAFRPVGSFGARVFGVGLACAGLSLSQARHLGLDAVESTVSREGSTCSLVYDSCSGRLLGAQMAGACLPSLSPPLSLLASQSVSLSSLAYADLGESTDISLLLQAARQGIAWRRGVGGEGAGLRPDGGGAPVDSRG